MFNPFNRKKKKELKKIEEELEKGKIILPTDLKDYVDLAEFKEKTSHISSIYDQLKEIEVEYTKNYVK